MNTLNYNQSIKFLYELQKFGIKVGLSGITILLKYFDNPHNKFKSIHIAGTNGKGSTASMLASIFTAAGYKTGLYTSPHLLKFNERIRINGKPISSQRVAQLTSAIKKTATKNSCTFFETVTAIAFKYFADEKVDIAIIETGLGGRLDATNILNPIASVITSVDLEHTQILGHSIKKIAYEKSGIIKIQTPCITACNNLTALNIIKNTCIKNHANLTIVKASDALLRKSTLQSITIDIKSKNIKKIKISLSGEHQKINALLATKCLDAIKSCGFIITNQDIRKGLKNIQKYSGLNARLSIIKNNPLIIADVAHNPQAMQTLCKSLKQLKLKKINVVIGIMQDKNYKKMVKSLNQCVRKAITVTAKTSRSLNSQLLADEFAKHNVESFSFCNVKSGVDFAISSKNKVPILITGSHFVVAEAIAYIKQEKYLTINQ